MTLFLKIASGAARTFTAAALLALVCNSPPASAAELMIPLTGHRTRPVEAATLFHTLFSDFFSESDGTTYVQTGDIPAMWQRDSAAQTIPYVRFAKASPILAIRFARVIERESRNELTDPYANAFTSSYGIWERKWEAGSPAWPIFLAWIYWRELQNRTLFTPAFHKAMRRAVDTWRCEQLHVQCSRYRPLAGSGASRPFNTSTGLIWAAYRPSDDGVRYPFNIPQEAMAASALGKIADLAIAGYHDQDLANEARSMSAQVQVGIERYGRIRTASGWMYVYETDGLGNNLFIDDANIPNLLTLPYIAFCSANDPVYLKTRAFVLSTRNPYYYRGIYAQGLGSPHTPDGFVWPLGIIGRALTATSSLEIAHGITTLAETDSRDGLIHESFNAGGYWEFTRADFGWANAFYAELLFRSVAGLAPASMGSSGMTLQPWEPESSTPLLSNQIVRFQNALLIYSALQQLLNEAGGRTTLPHARNVIMRTARI